MRHWLGNQAVGVVILLFVFFVGPFPLRWLFDFLQHRFAIHISDVTADSIFIASFIGIGIIWRQMSYTQTFSSSATWKKRIVIETIWIVFILLAVYYAVSFSMLSNTNIGFALIPLILPFFPYSKVEHYIFRYRRSLQ